MLQGFGVSRLGVRVWDSGFGLVLLIIVDMGSFSRLLFSVVLLLLLRVAGWEFLNGPGSGVRACRQIKDLGFQSSRLCRVRVLLDTTEHLLATVLVKLLLPFLRSVVLN